MSTSDVPMCAQCEKRPAVCLGLYEGENCAEEPPCTPMLCLCTDATDQPACDECCAHGNEDGHCHPIYGDGDGPS